MNSPSLHELPAPPAGKSGWPWTEGGARLPDTTPAGRPWPLVSIVTPSFNQAAYLEETIRSVLLQGYPNLEYIVVDGGSTDGSVEIIRSYAPWLAYWVSKPDRGQTQAINKGWSKARGSILAYLNSDDTYLPGAVARAARAFELHPQAGMVYSSAILVGQDGRPRAIWPAQPFSLKTMLVQQSIVPQPAAFFAARALARVGYLDEQWQMIMDYELCVRLGMRFPAVCLPEAGACFRLHPTSKTRSSGEATMRELMRFAVAFFAQRPQLEDLRAIQRTTISRIHYERALTYARRGRASNDQALRALRSSLVLDASFALSRPRQTAYLLKELLLGSFGR